MSLAWISAPAIFVLILQLIINASKVVTVDNCGRTVWQNDMKDLFNSPQSYAVAMLIGMVMMLVLTKISRAKEETT